MANDKDRSDPAIDMASNRSPMSSRTMHIWLPRVLVGAVGLVLMTSGLLKATDMDLFIRQFRGYGIISQHSLLVLSAWLVLLAEFTLGTALIVFYRPRWSVPLTALLLLIFLCATAWAWLTGITEECGCFGSWVDRTPGEAAVEDLLLLAALIPGWFWHGYSSRPGGCLKLSAIVAASLIGLFMPLLFGFPLSRIGAPGKEYLDIRQEFPEIQDAVRTDLSHGAYILILMSTDCLHCRDAVGELNIWEKERDFPGLIALSADDTGQIEAFVREYEPVYPVVKVTGDAFRRLLGDRKVPCLLLLRDQEILKVWDETVPDMDSVREAMKQS